MKSIVLGYIIIFVFAFSPLFITIIGVAIGRFFGYQWHEGNSSIGAFAWLTFFTAPAGMVLAIIWTIISIYLAFKK